MKYFYLIFTVFLIASCSVSDAITLSNETPTSDNKQDIKAPESELNKVWRFAVVSDFNGSYGSTTYSSRVKSAVQYLKDNKDNIDFAISTGDMVAGQRKNLDYGAMWEAFHSTVTRPLKDAQLPLYPSPGNHDAYITRTVERTFYKNTWMAEKVLSIPSQFELVPGVEQNYPFSYAFTVGPALFIALDNTDPRPFSVNTVDWIENVLKQNKDIKNKFIFGHIPLLPFAFKKETEYIARSDKAFLDKMENLFEKYNVSAFLSGHSHVYYPGKRLGKTQYISVPLLGGGPRYLITKKQDEARSQHGFLMIEYSQNGEMKMTSLKSSDYTEVLDSDLPELLDMPSQNTGKCSRCKNFPKTMFLDQDDRILYLRRDQ